MNESNETPGAAGAKVTQAEGGASPTKWGWGLECQVKGRSLSYRWQGTMGGI